MDIAETIKRLIDATKADSESFSSQEIEDLINDIRGILNFIDVTDALKNWPLSHDMLRKANV